MSRNSKLNDDERIRAVQEYLDGNESNAGILLCMYTGLRVGEICGLRWGDIDFSEETLTVQRTVQHVNLRGKSKVIVGTPKSKTSVRTIPVPQFVMEQIMRFRSGNHAFLLSGTSKPIEPRTMQNRFKAILKQCCIRDMPFHRLCHSYASLCVELGFDVKTLSELLGHADASLTLNRYVHSSMEQKKFVERFTMCA